MSRRPAITGGFRHRGAMRSWEMRFGPNMTPMVDVVLVILIFYMSASAVVGPEWFLRAGLARRGDGGAPDPFALPAPEFRLELAVGEGGRTVATGLGLTRAGLAEVSAALRGVVKETGPDAILTLDPSPGVPYQDVVAVQDGAAAAGFTRVALAAAR